MNQTQAVKDVLAEIQERHDSPDDLANFSLPILKADRGILLEMLREIGELRVHEVHGASKFDLDEIEPMVSDVELQEILNKQTPMEKQP